MSPTSRYAKRGVAEQRVGEFGEAVAVLEKAGITAEQVVNSCYGRLLKFLGLEDIPDTENRAQL